MSVQITVDLDDDVVALRERACKQLNMTLEEFDNAALRIGLAEMAKAEEPEPDK